MIAATFHVLIVIAFVVRVLLRDGVAPTTRVAWIMVISLLPVAGGLIYLLFGEVSFSARIRRADAELHRDMAARADTLLSGSVADPDHITSRFQPAFAFCRSINGFDTLSGNSAKLLPEGRGAWDAVLAEIETAQHTIDLCTFIWLDDATGTAMAEALMAAARRGVTVRLLADAVGARFIIRSELWAQMAEAGVSCVKARPIGMPIYNFAKGRLDLRNHRKCVIIDGQVAFLGSQNIADPEFRVKPRFAPWVDLMMRVEGPVVTQAQLLFAGDWVSTEGGALSDVALSPAPQAGEVLAQMMGDGPTNRTLAMPNLVAALLHAATERVTISTPYFVPDAILSEAIASAAHRGVAVTLILPARNDSRIVAAASEASYRKLLDAGVIIREYRPGLLHAKSLTVDGRVSLIGSSNLDLRSFDLNDENNLLIHDASLTAEIEARQADFIAASDEITAEAVAEWSYLRRIWNNMVATLGPVL